jgi:hypothetical protein
MADGFAGLQTAIVNGFGPGVLRLMCFYHEIEMVRRKIKTLTKAQRDMIVDDVRFMQRAETENEFFKLVGLFLSKWREYDVESVSLSSL